MIKNRTIFTEDNLPVLRGMESESVDLIYLDPPFNSNRHYEAPIGTEAAGAAFKDAWTLDDTDEAWWGEIAEKHPELYRVIDAIGATAGQGGKGYSIYMAIRLLEMRRLLKPTGSIYLHCDPTMSHSLKLVMDAVWKGNNFRNEIIWCYRTGGASPKRSWSKKHDVLLMYVNGKHYVFNPQRSPSYLTGQLKHAKDGKMLQDEHGAYQIVRFSKTDIKLYKDAHNRYYTMAGTRDYWADIDAIGRSSKERTGYPTQKPLALLQRIIKASSNEGDVILDPFCGCATACLAAEAEGRQWIGIDISPLAFNLIKNRLEKELGLLLEKDLVIQRTDIPQRESDRAPRNIKHILFGKQEGICNGCKYSFPFRNFTLDHIVPVSQGGGDNEDNLQLLCGACNAKKGDRPMEYLVSQLKQEGMTYESEFTEGGPSSNRI